MSKTESARNEVKDFLVKHPDRWISMVALSEVFDIDWGFLDRGLTDLAHFYREKFKVRTNLGNTSASESQLRTFLCYSEKDVSTITPPRNAQV